MPRMTLAIALGGCMTAAATLPAWAQTVKATPLGSHEANCVAGG